MAPHPPPYAPAGRRPGAQRARRRPSSKNANTAFASGSSDISRVSRAGMGAEALGPLACCRHARTLPPVLDQRLVAHRRPPAAPRRQPQHRDPRRHARGLRGCARLLPAGLAASPACSSITVFVFSDMIDGYMARTSGQISPFGAFLDSTLDRIGDAAIFGGLAMYYVGPGDNELGRPALAIYCLSMGSVTSYARARAESLGMQAKVGIAERSDRLVLILAADRAGRPAPSPGRRRRGDVADPDRARGPGRGQHDHGRAADPRRTSAGPRPAAPHRIGTARPAALESGHG